MQHSSACVCVPCNQSSIQHRATLGVEDGRDDGPLHTTYHSTSQHSAASHTYQQHGLQLLPAVSIRGYVVKAASINDLVRHVDLLLLDDVAHQALYAVRKHDLLPGRLLLLLLGVLRQLRAAVCCWRRAGHGPGAPRLVGVRREALALCWWVSDGLQVQHTHLHSRQTHNVPA